MRITVDRKQLATALTRAVPLVADMPEGARIAILRADGEDRVSVEARGRMVSAMDTIPARVDRGGEAGVNAANTLKLLRAMVAYAFVTIEIEEDRTNRVRISAGDTEAVLDATAHEEWAAPIDAAEGGVGEDLAWTGACAEVSGVLARVLPVCAGEDNRYGVSAVLIEFGDGRARFVATDGHGLLYTSIAVDAISAGSILLLRACASAVAAYLQGRPEGARVGFSQGKRAVTVTAPNCRVVARIAESVFPDYRQVIPPTPARGSGVRLDRAKILSAITRCKQFARDTHSTTRVEVDNGTMKLTVRRLDEVLREEIAVEGPDVPLLGLNAALGEKLIGASRVSEMEMHFTGSLSPVLWVPDDSGSLVVIMPIRLE